jgi:hypothetical protein
VNVLYLPIDMKNYIICLFLTFFLTSCVKETDFDTNISKHSDYPQVEQPQDVIYDLSNSSWVITKIMYTDFMYEERSDTLIFDSLGNYSFNGFMSNYNFYPNVVNYRLDLYDTPWGSITGTIYESNIETGKIEGINFTDIFNDNVYRMWMYKIN